MQPTSCLRQTTARGKGGKPAFCKSFDGEPSKKSGRRCMATAPRRQPNARWPRGSEHKIEETVYLCSDVTRPNLNITVRDASHDRSMPLFVNPNAIRHYFFSSCPDKNHAPPSELQP